MHLSSVRMHDGRHVAFKFLRNRAIFQGTLFTLSRFPQTNIGPHIGRDAASHKPATNYFHSCATMSRRSRYPDSMQARTRTERGFVKTESDLSNYSGSDSPNLPKFPTSSKLNDILSYFGSRNPLPRSVSKKDTVWLFDNTAYRNSKTGRWEAEFVSAVFAQHPSCVVIDAVTTVAKEIGLEDSNPEHATIEERILPFLQDIRPGTQVKALHAGSLSLSLGPGGRNGISNDIN